MVTSLLVLHGGHDVVSLGAEELPAANVAEELLELELEDAAYDGGSLGGPGIVLVALPAAPLFLLCLQCTGDLWPVGTASDGEEEGGLAVAADYSHGVVVQLPHVPGTAGEGGREDDPVADVGILSVLSQPICDGLPSPDPEVVLMSSNPHQLLSLNAGHGVQDGLLPQPVQLPGPWLS